MPRICCCMHKLRALLGWRAQCSSRPDVSDQPEWLQVARDVFQRYFNLARRALSDAAATSAAGAAGIRPTGDLLQPLHQYVPLLREQSLHGRQGLEAAQAAEAGVLSPVGRVWAHAAGMAFAGSATLCSLARCRTERLLCKQRGITTACCAS